MRTDAASQLPASAGRAVLAAVLSALLPGTGHLYARRPRRAVGYLVFSGISLVAVGVLVVLGPTGIARLLVSTGWILTAFIALIISALIRLIAAYDAYQLLRPFRRKFARQMLASSSVLAIIGALIVIPHVVVTRAAWAHHGVVTTVFPDAAPKPVAPTPDTDPAPEPVPSVTAEPPESPSDPDGDSNSDAPGHEEITDPADLPDPDPDIWGDDDRYTVLLLGSDAGPDRAGGRTDSMMLLTISREDRSAVLIGLPRNLQDIPFISGPMRDRFPEGFDDMANAVYPYGVANPDLFGDVADPGATALEQAIAEATGLEIDNWAMVDLAGIVGIIDALGGLDLHVPKAVSDRVSAYEPGGPRISADISAGDQHLTPEEVYVYVRTRSADSDYSRMARQRCVMAAIGEDLLGPKLLTAYPKLADSLIENVTTDIPKSWLPDLVTLGAQMDLKHVSTLMLVPPLFNTTDPDYGQMRALIADAIEGNLPDASQSADEITSACE